VEASKHAGFGSRGNRENGNCGQHRQNNLTFHHNSPLYGFGEIEYFGNKCPFTTLITIYRITTRKKSVTPNEIPNITLFPFLPIHHNFFDIVFNKVRRKGSQPKNKTGKYTTF
jgi:hypothetical protein